ncbi:hypothetical protein NDU88_009607 [Pleurodeles waltl]|uniref:Uncharacterized protein n=1 Tax=Pleurodeles waltl TaxID=8319 RepID=A0AAV7S0X3_PLEWA|nr:hypothetical protein NDU88_009607 [Pleurodeles waltl]
MDPASADNSTIKGSVKKSKEHTLSVVSATFETVAPNVVPTDDEPAGTNSDVASRSSNGILKQSYSHMTIPKTFYDTGWRAVVVSPFGFEMEHLLRSRKTKTKMLPIRTNISGKL